MKTGLKMKTNLQFNPTKSFLLTIKTPLTVKASKIMIKRTKMTQEKL